MIIDRRHISTLKNCLIYSNFWVAFSLTCLTMAYDLQAASINSSIVILNFLIAFTGYNYLYLVVFYMTPNKIVSKRADWIQQHKVLLTVLTLLSAAASSYLATKASHHIQIRLLAFTMFSFLYILPTKRNIGLRWIPSIKIILIATIWTFLVTLNLQASLTTSLTTFAAIWLFVFGITIPFDIRDIKTDPATLKTIPQLIGIEASIMLSQCCIILSMALMTYVHYSPKSTFANITFAAICLLFIHQLKYDKSARYINFYIEGLPIIWLIVIAMVNLV